MTDVAWQTIGGIVLAFISLANLLISKSAQREAKQANKQASEAHVQSTKNSTQLTKVHEKVNGNLDAAIRQARVRRPPQVLIIDDDDNDQELQANLLRECGCEVFQAKTGIEAHQIIVSRIRGERGFPFDWAFLDVRLAHGEDARDVLQILDRIVPDMFVAILTGHATNAIIEDICKDGRFMITKPLSAKHVRRIIHNLGLE
jgi:CheY-like chemotaxis protein